MDCTVEHTAVAHCRSELLLFSYADILILLVLLVAANGAVGCYLVGVSVVGLMFSLPLPPPSKCCCYILIHKVRGEACVRFVRSKYLPYDLDNRTRNFSKVRYELDTGNWNFVTIGTPTP